MQGSEISTETDRRARWLDAALFVGAIAMAALWCILLARQAAGASFGSDECFHAYVSRWIVENGRLPEAIAGLYGGFDYYYQPLMHLIGAVVMAPFGESALRFLPLAFAGIMLLVIALGAPGVIPRHARGWALLLCVLSGLLATYAVRLYVESLAALMITAAGVALVHQQERGGRIATAGLGVLAGLAVLAKFAGWTVFLLLLPLLLVRLVRGEVARVRSLAAALGIGLLVAAPWLIRNQILFGSALYPIGAPDLDRDLFALHRTHFSIPSGVFLSGLPKILGPFMLAMNAMAVLSMAIERRWGLREGLWAFAAGGIVAAAFIPLAAARHLTAFLPLLALTSAWIVAEALARRALLIRPVGVVLLVAAGVALARFPDHRAGANPPPPLMDGFAAIERLTPDRATVLSLWTYDTFYYGKRSATWPVAWGQERSPLELFQTSDPMRFIAVLDSLGISHVLAPQSAPLELWDGSNYPESFVGCVRELVERRELQVAWQSDHVVLLRRGP